MILYAIDDEPLMLGELEDAITEAVPGVVLYTFTRPTAVLEALENGNPYPDAVFLDIELPGMGGLELARQMKQISPKTWIIFVTGFSQYAADAYSQHAEGYIVKPVTAEKIQAELEQPAHMPLSIRPQKRIQVQTFGNFDVIVDGKSLHFPRKKAKELFAYLIHRKGAVCTSREIAAILFEDASGDKKQLDYLNKIVAALRKSLEAVKAEDILCFAYNSYAIDVTKVECDYYHLLEDDSEENIPHRYNGEYMSQYSWAETTVPALNENI